MATDTSLAVLLENILRLPYRPGYREHPAISIDPTLPRPVSHRDERANKPEMIKPEPVDRQSESMLSNEFLCSL